MSCLRHLAILIVPALLFVLAKPHPAAAVELETHESAHYQIHTNLPVEEVRPLARHMDQMFEEYTRRFRDLVGRRSDREKQNLYLVASNADYLNLLASFGINASGSGGMFFVRAGNQGLATWVHDRPERNVIQTLQHEGFHQFAYRYIGTELPVWANEGLAVYFEQAMLVNRRFRIGIAEGHRIQTVKSALEAETHFTIDQLMNITSEAWSANLADPRVASLQYSQSWTICYFLIHANNGRYQRAFSQYLELVASGRRSEQAFETAFGTNDYAALETRWREFVEEELEPDDFSSMANRIEFLANGVVAATGAGETLPDSLEAYKQLLQSGGFAMRNALTGEVLSADDEEVYRYNDSRGRPHDFEYEIDPDNGLPMISAGASRPRARIEWITETESLSFRVVYD